MQVEVVTIEKSELSRIIERTAFAVAMHLRSEFSKPIPEIMTKAELADYLRCDVSKINRLMKEDLPYEIFGSHPRFRKTSIDDWLQNGSVQEIQGQAS